jgi:hypothetical protein
MRRDKEFDNILNECLERMLLKGESIKQCLADYPEMAIELKPLLETALAARKASMVQPSPEFKAKARYQFRSALSEMAAPKHRSFFSRVPRWAMAVVSLVLVLLLAGGGTVAAAGDSMPDSPLYPVKLATEQVRLVVTTTDIGKANLYNELAGKRVAEIVCMADKGDAQQIELITQRLDENLGMMVVLVSGQANAEPSMLMMTPGESLTGSGEAPQVTGETVETLPPTAISESPFFGFWGKGKGGWGRSTHASPAAWSHLKLTVEHSAAGNGKALRAALGKAPPSARQALLIAITVLNEGYEEALSALGID